MSLNYVEKDGQNQYVCGTHVGKVFKIIVSSIICVNAEDKYVKVQHTGGTPRYVETSLKTMQTTFPSNFMLVHRSYFIDMTRVTNLVKKDDKVWLKLEGADTMIPVSRRNVAAVRKALVTTTT